MSIKLKLSDIPNEEIGREIYNLVKKIPASNIALKHVFIE